MRERTLNPPDLVEHKSLNAMDKAKDISSLARMTMMYSDSYEIAQSVQHAINTGHGRLTRLEIEVRPHHWPLRVSLRIQVL